VASIWTRSLGTCLADADSDADAEDAADVYGGSWVQELSHEQATTTMPMRVLLASLRGGTCQGFDVVHLGNLHGPLLVDHMWDLEPRVVPWVPQSVR